jgi:hypothetical protein
VFLYEESEQAMFNLGNGSQSNRYTVSVEDRDLSTIDFRNEIHKQEHSISWMRGIPRRLRTIGYVLTAGAVLFEDSDMTAPYKDRVIALGLIALVGLGGTEGLQRTIMHGRKKDIERGEARLDTLKFHYRRLMPRKRDDSETQDLAIVTELPWHHLTFDLDFDTN